MISIRVSGFAYVVKMDGQTHAIYRGLTCSCGQPDCEAGKLVVDWVKGEYGQIAPKPPAGFTPYLPKACPVCGAEVMADHSLSSANRGIGWRCAKEGVVHYWMHKWEVLKPWFFREDLGILKRKDVPSHFTMGYWPECNK